MNTLIGIRDNLKKLYSEYDMILKPILRFLVALSFLVLLKSYIGYNEEICRPAVILILSLICALFPAGFIALVSTCFILGNMYGVSLSLFLLGSVLTMLVIMLYFGFRPGKAFYIILIPISFLLKIPYSMPVILALTGGLAAAVPVSIGVFLWYILEYFHQNALNMEFSMDPETVISDFVDISLSIFTDKRLYITLCAFLVCIGVVYLLSRLSIDYSFIIAAVSGLILLGAVSIAGNYYFETDCSVSSDLLRLLFSLPVIIIYVLLFFSVDYRATEHLQFEDDQYYYYVKAVPKVTSEDEPIRKE